jgi:outer membrane protein TolC
MGPNRRIGRRLVFVLLLGPFWLAGTALAQQPAELPQAPKDRLPTPTAVNGTRPAPAPTTLGDCVRPIDLPSAMLLAGVQNPEILIARERVAEAIALRQLAAAQILPTINVGTNVNVHDGPLQTSTGQIIKVNRGAMYLGLGANAVGAGTVNIPGIVWNGNVSQVLFAALVAKRIVRQRQFESDAERNDVLLRVATAYLELLRAEGRLAVLAKTREETREVARVTQVGEKVGQQRKADADRALAELEQRNSEVIEAEGAAAIASARLCQLLGLDPSVRLHATDGWVVPAPIVPPPVPLCELLAISLAQRPELFAQRAAIRAAFLELRGAKLLPFSPNLIVGYSAGTFGGGSNLVSHGIVQADGTVLRQPRFDSFAPREDIDVVVYWTARNLGLGNLALVRLQQSRLRTQDLRLVEVLNRVRAEVATAYARAQARFAQIDIGERAVRAGTDAFREDLTRTRAGVGLPIEVLDSLRLLGRSRLTYLDAIVDYNRAQFELYVALGSPPADTLARPVPADLVPPPQTPPAPPPR